MGYTCASEAAGGGTAHLGPVQRTYSSAWCHPWRGRGTPLTPPHQHPRGRQTANNTYEEGGEQAARGAGGCSRSVSSCVQCRQRVERVPPQERPDTSRNTSSADSGVRHKGTPATPLTCHTPHLPRPSPVIPLTCHAPHLLHPSPATPLTCYTPHLPHPSPATPLTCHTPHLPHPSPVIPLT